MPTANFMKTIVVLHARPDVENGLDSITKHLLVRENTTTTFLL